MGAGASVPATEEDARAAGYTDDDISAYKATLEEAKPSTVTTTDGPAPMATTHSAGVGPAPAPTPAEISSTYSMGVTPAEISSTHSMGVAGVGGPSEKPSSKEFNVVKEAPQWVVKLSDVMAMTSIEPMQVLKKKGLLKIHEPDKVGGWDRLPD